MATLNTTTFNHLLKRVYTPKHVENLVYPANPFFAMIKKEVGFGGAAHAFTMLHQPNTGVSSTFSTAQSNAGGASGKQFLLTRAKTYAVAKIDTETIEASKGDEGALMAAVTREVDSSMHNLVRDAAIGMYRDGSGALGTVKSDEAAGQTTIDLTKDEDVCNFEVGMELVFATSKSASLKAGSITVTAVDRNASGSNHLTVDNVTNIATGDGLAANDIIYRQGDYVTASDRLKISGLDAWIPATAPVLGSDSFFGIDRGSDSRLYGHALSGSGKTIEEAIYDAAVRAAREGGKPDVCFLDYSNYAKLQNLLGSKVQYETHKVGEVGFQGIKIIGPRGPIMVYPDQNCPQDNAYILQMDTWRLKTINPAPSLIKNDGLRWARIYNEDAIEIRSWICGNMYTTAAGHNARTTL
jgi:hypothetical protein